MAQSSAITGPVRMVMRWALRPASNEHSVRQTNHWCRTVVSGGAIQCRRNVVELITLRSGIRARPIVIAPRRPCHWQTRIGLVQRSVWLALKWAWGYMSVDNAATNE